MRQLRARIIKLDKWIAEETANTAPPTLSDVISDILNRQGQSGISRLKAASQMLVFLQENEIYDMAALESKVKSMNGNIHHVRYELKPVERRLKTLDEHIRQGEIYRKYKGKNRAESEKILFIAAQKYLTANLNGHSLDLKAWKAGRSTKTIEKNRLYTEYYSLKDETKKVEQIRRSVWDILREDNHKKQPTRGLDVEL